MRVVQILPTLAYGDAVGNDTLALYHIIKKAGYKTRIYAENIDARVQLGDVKHVSELIKLSKEDVAIYHLSTGTELNYSIAELPCRIIVQYHNVTPPDFLEPYNPMGAALCRQGLEGAKYLADKAEYCIADSEFNKQDLINMGYRCPIDVLPILIPFEDYNKTPSKKIANRYSDDYTNLVFTGRLAPNKKQEDVIEAFYYYNKYYNPKSRLFLVGSYQGMELYYNRLYEYSRQLGLKNVIFTGHIPFDEVLAYFRLADVFLCMSEHEGFCVPLVEAMYFNIPIVAYDSCAIAGTLNGSGILLKEKNALETAGVLDRVMREEKLRERVLSGQAERLKGFENKRIAEQFLEYLERFMKSR